MAGRKRQLTIGEAALRGAAAGLIGGAVVMAARRLDEKRLLTGGAAADIDWQRTISRTARQRGLRLSTRQRTVAGVGAHLAYSALLGAVLGVVGSRSTRLADVALEVLSYAEAVPRLGFAPEPPVARRGLRRARRGVIPLRTDRLYGLATRAALRALTKGAVR